MSSTAKPSTDAKMEVDAPKKKQIPALGVLEEDDEFEEFPAQDFLNRLMLADWEDRDTDIANLTNPSSSGASKNVVDNLWEDNWDDDDVEDDFSKQLRQACILSCLLDPCLTRSRTNREEVAKQQASRPNEPQPMTH
ncbi:hypothetical protein FRC06_005597 [Ceratobasidium sp. 370]|nr:hypothetical protein FRC06_005597 [Ceratobasidium sp. 370]